MTVLRYVQVLATNRSKVSDQIQKYDDRQEDLRGKVIGLNAGAGKKIIS